MTEILRILHTGPTSRKYNILALLGVIVWDIPTSSCLHLYLVQLVLHKPMSNFPNLNSLFLLLGVVVYPYQPYIAMLCSKLISFFLRWVVLFNVLTNRTRVTPHGGRANKRLVSWANFKMHPQVEYPHNISLGLLWVIATYLKRYNIHRVSSLFTFPELYSFGNLRQIEYRGKPSPSKILFTVLLLLQNLLLLFFKLAS